MRFKVPQFLDIEDKIFGPFTFSQFVYLVGGAGISFVLYRSLGLGLAIIPIILIGGLSLALTFYKPNNKPFVNMLESFILYLTQNKLYIWKRKKVKIKAIEKKSINEENIDYRKVRKLNKDKLNTLAWSLDILETKNIKNE